MGGLYLEGLIHGGASEFYGTFHKRGFALRVVFKVRGFGTRKWVKWPIQWRISPIMQLTLIKDVDHYMGEQGRHSAESTRLPPMFASIPPSVHPLIPPLNPGADATRGLFFCVIAFALTGFFPGCTGFLPSLKNKPNTKT